MQFSRFHHTIRILFATCVLFCSLSAYAATVPNALYIVGTTMEDGSLDFSDKYKFIEDTEGVLCCKNVPVYISSQYHEVSIAITTATGEDGWSAGSYVRTGDIREFGEYLTFYQVGQKRNTLISVSAGNYDFYMDFNGAAPVLYIFDSEHRIPSDLYLVGYINGVEEFDIDGAKMEFDEDACCFRLSDVEVVSSGTMFGQVAITSANNSEWNMQLSYKLQVSSLTEIDLEKNQIYPMTFVKPNSGTAAVFSIPVGRYNMAADFSHLYPVLSIEKASDPIETGVESVSVDTESRTEYYTLDGIRIDNPQRGVFIKRTAGSASLIRL